MNTLVKLMTYLIQKHPKYYIKQQKDRLTIKNSKN